MTSAHNTEVGKKLETHFANLRSRATGGALKRSRGNWQVYAAVAGSTMAIATNASAASIVYSGERDITASVASIGPFAGGSASHLQIVGGVYLSALAGNPNMPLQVDQVREVGCCGSFIAGQARLRPAAAIDFLGGSGIAKRLSSGAEISNGAGSFGQFNAQIGSHQAFGHGGHATQSGSPSGEWPAGVPGFAGFQTAEGFGWIRLEYTLSANGLPNTITAIDWAYTTDGSSIQAGEEVAGSGTPEPSSSALGLLAAGAAGVAALRRRREFAVRSGMK